MRRSWAEKVCQFRQQRTRHFHSDEDDARYDYDVTARDEDNLL